MKRILIGLMALSLLLLTGCRTRTTAALTAPGQGRELEAGAAGQGDAAAGSGLSGMLSTPDDTDTSPESEADAVPTEDPGAQRKEYDDDAASKITVLAGQVIQAPGEGEGASGKPEEDSSPTDRLDEHGSQTATLTMPAESADRMGTAENAEEADTQLVYYTVLLEERTGALFECQRRDLYWETTQDLRTVFKTSKEHRWILQVGCYDVSARLLEENLTVDAGWVQRKNPGVIVKVVDRTVLGYGVTDAGKAAAVWDTLAARPGWADIDAVRNRRIVLVSEQLLTSQRLLTAALVAIAKEAAPEAFADVDPAEAVRALSQEESGAPAEGLFIYVKE